ncbi:arylformamidase [Planomicrobium sp. YIM 101495]|uniref:arylformamidase n=1 Tax=Planomicrobium sp. YIM 101495 TaxID=2665160 RepID=UPI0012B7A5C2|nr:arylformamidase [Planomicrobium sp. YIM 101495]MTD31618.1 arylformamidase [Planomicrobium sp. YIM 101495]
MTKEIIDITMPLRSETPEWPGDTPFDFHLSVTKEQSGSVNIGQLTASTHIGTHIDAPFHYDEHGMTVEQLPLNVYLTTAQVVDVTGLKEITESDMPEVKSGVTAILLKTNAWTDRSVFPSAWPLFDPAIASWMSEHAITLLGVDVPSIDPETSKELPMHHAMKDNHRYILEGIVLDKVAEGVYGLTALPLKIAGADGSPVRAVLTH